MNLEPMQKAAVLIEALPISSVLTGKSWWVNMASAMVDEELKKRSFRMCAPISW
ncbi:MAG: hypothetical protein ACLR0U_05375 [Enterocloster clostridioformis]